MLRSCDDLGKLYETSLILAHGRLTIESHDFEVMKIELLHCTLEQRIWFECSKFREIIVD